MGRFFRNLTDKISPKQNFRDRSLYGNQPPPQQRKRGLVKTSDGNIAKTLVCGISIFFSVISHWQIKISNKTLLCHLDSLNIIRTNLVQQETTFSTTVTFDQKQKSYEESFNLSTNSTQLTFSNVEIFGLKS